MAPGVRSDDVENEFLYPSCESCLCMRPAARAGSIDWLYDADAQILGGFAIQDKKVHEPTDQGSIGALKPGVAQAPLCCKHKYIFSWTEIAVVRICIT